MFVRRVLLLLLGVALTGLPAVVTPVGANETPDGPVLITLNAPEAVIGDARRTFRGAMDSAQIARTAQSVVAAIEAAGGVASIPSYRFPYVVATLPDGFNPFALSAVKAVTDVPQVSRSLDTVRGIIEVSETTPALTLGTDGAANSDVLRGTGQNIAVIDSGLDASHEFFRDGANNSRVIAEACFTQLADCPTGIGTDTPGTGLSSSGPGTSHPLPNDDPANPTAPTANNSHGMHIAGIAAGRRPGGAAPTRGVAPDAGLIGIRTFPVNSNVGDLTDLVAALEWLVSWIDADTPNRKVAVLNLSLGFDCPNPSPSSGVSKNVFDLIEALRGRGVVTVAAAGNNESRSAISAPACYSNTIAVSATSGAAGSEVIASYANVSSTVDVAAPGTSVLSSGASSAYGLLTGTSMAAPVVAGVVALARQANPDLSGDAFFTLVRNALSTNITINDTRSSGTVTGIPLLRLPTSVTSQPTTVAVTATDSQATVTFNVPTERSASVTSYTVTTKKIVGETATTVGTPCVRALGATRTCTLSGLNVGDTYRFDVTAANLFGTSAVAESTTVTIQAAPAPAPAPAPSPAPAPASSVVFSDTASSVHAASIGVLVERGVLRGCGVDLFCPRNTVTRGQFATMLANVMELPARPAGSSGFVDVDGHTHAAGIRAVTSAGLFGGVSATRFDPNAPMLRGQIASVLAGAAGLAPRPANQFSDTAGSVHAGSIGAVVEAGLARGTSTTTFAPSARLPREQAVTLLVNLIEFRER